MHKQVQAWLLWHTALYTMIDWFIGGQLTISLLFFTKPAAFSLFVCLHSPSGCPPPSCKTRSVSLYSTFHTQRPFEAFTSCLMPFVPEGVLKLKTRFWKCITLVLSSGIMKNYTLAHSNACLLHPNSASSSAWPKVADSYRARSKYHVMSPSLEASRTNKNRIN